jgi:GNAT superfamily N-acetyltransferase
MTEPADTSPTVRRAAASDQAQIADVYLSAVHQSLPWLRLAHSDADVRRWVPEAMLPKHEVWVTTQAGTVRAFVALSPGRDWVAHLYVAPSSQHRGLGSQLLEQAKLRSWGWLRLWAFQRNVGARAFYENRGFRAVLFTDGSGNEEREPDILYEWELAQAEG